MKASINTVASSLDLPIAIALICIRSCAHRHALTHTFARANDIYSRAVMHAGTVRLIIINNSRPAESEAGVSIARATSSSFIRELSRLCSRMAIRPQGFLFAGSHVLFVDGFLEALISAGASAALRFLTGRVARFSRLEINEKVRRASGSFGQTITLR